MTSKLHSRTWSCSELVRGAAQVVDSMPAPSLDHMVVEQRQSLLSETSCLGVEQLEKLLQDDKLWIIIVMLVYLMNFSPTLPVRLLVDVVTERIKHLVKSALQ